MDEKSMILEQERQKKAKKRKKFRKLKWIAGVLVVLLVAGGIWYGIKGRYLLAEAESASVEIVAEDGQEIVYAQIVSINGNEVTYTVVDTSLVTMMQSQITQSSSQKENSSEDAGFSGMGGGQMPDMENMEMPEGMDFSGMGNGQMPDMENMEMPEGMDFSGMGNGQMPDMENMEMPEGMDFSSMGGAQGGRGNRGKQSEDGTEQGAGMQTGEGMDVPSDSIDGTQAGEAGKGRGNKEQGMDGMPIGEHSTETAEQITTYIPVGTDVTTKLGTVTTFSRLAAGDYVAFVMEADGEEQIIMAVYIVG